MEKKYYTPETQEELLTYIINEKHCYAQIRDPKYDTAHSSREVAKIKIEGIKELSTFLANMSDYNVDKESYVLNHENYLLPCLSKEDIESLGWISDNPKLYTYPESKMEMYAHKDNKDLRLGYGCETDNNWLLITERSDSYNDKGEIVSNNNFSNFSMGTIKNLFELKKEMKRIWRDLPLKGEFEF